MEQQDSRSARRLKLVTRAILIVGFAAAIAAYVLARARPQNPLGYDPLDTKKYLHDLEMYGGTANVLAAEFREWFAGLWYGTNLAYTIAVLTVLIALAVRFFVRLSQAELDEGEDGRPAEPGPSPRPGPRRLP